MTAHPTSTGEDSSDNFRVNEVKFLQEQHSAAVAALARIEEQRDDARAIIREYETNQEAVEKEYEADRNDLRGLEQEEREQRIQLQQHNENIREAAVTNTNIKDMSTHGAYDDDKWSSTVSLVKNEEEEIVNLKAEQKGSIAEEIRLEGIADEFKNMKKLNEEQVVFTENEAAKVKEMLRQITQEHEQTAAAIKNMEAQAKSEMDSLEEALKIEKKRNTELLQQCRHNEVAERRMTQEIGEMKRLCDEERKELVRLEAMRDGSAYEHEQYINEKGELVRRLEMLKDQNEKYSESITEVESNNEKAREKYNEQAEKFRNMGDQVFRLMDQLRMVQLERRKRIESVSERRKRADHLENANAQSLTRIQIEHEARQNAEAALRKAEQVLNLLRKKQRSLEETHTMAIRVQEKTERDASQLRDNLAALTTRNQYLINRVDGQEEDSSALKQRIAETQQELYKLRQTDKELRGQLLVSEDAEAELSADIAKLNAEIDFVKRTDMLDENGRMKPIQIESDGSDLVSRLQINEFLYRAQQEPREAVALIIEKLSHLLELVHGAQSQGHQYLGDLDRSNGYMKSLRNKNKELLEDVVTLERFRGRTLLQVITNALACPGGKKPDLLLEGLGYTVAEVYELLRMLHAADSAQQIEVIDLSKNDLNDEAVPLLCEIINMLSYLKLLDVSENYLTPQGIGKLSNFIKGMEGITSVLQNDDKIAANSGAQTRIQVKIGSQKYPDEKELEARAALGSDISGPNPVASEKAKELLSNADTFLESDGAKRRENAQASSELPPIKPPPS
ncbi:hypothetical protein FOL46_002985 [Perkinsus olseni]|uniref:Uncharacterized protein n=1 Tax=Perkinsus olseni TaxID=32597 RepID=A0A7J6MU02_PEROL|nr:hypothetical protein FOL46_002985 [Perkinsus olseni]